MKIRLCLKILLWAALALVLCFALLVAYLSVTEYRPKERQEAELINISNDNAEAVSQQLTVFTWNIGYCGLDANADFFMDGGKSVNPKKEAVEENLTAVKDFIAAQSADAWLLQEVDVDSARTGSINELAEISSVYGGSFGLSYNYKCEFVPIPLPPMGKMESGIATFTNRTVKSDTFERVALPCPFSWPVSIANLKRCLLVTRLEVTGSDKEVVLVNLHLEAYDDGSGKIAQTKLLTDFLYQEYEKGNYVIAGGDFNQVFPDTLQAYPVAENVWAPGNLEEDDLPSDFGYAFDSTTPTCRLLDRPYDENSQLYVIDGFILSPNVQVEMVETVDLGFVNSDHNPVKLQVTLQK